jgi:signal peptidase I
MKIDNKNFCRIARVFFLFIVFSVIFHLGYSFSKVEGDSMNPTFKDGQRLLVDEWTYKFFNPERGEVVILKDPEEKGDELVKRVIATEGDVVQIKYGKIFLNGSEFNDPFSGEAIIFYVNEEMTLWFNENGKETKVPKGYVWVIGDNREMSWYGMVKVSKIQGKILR